MRTFSYTLSQKKQKKIKIANTNRDPYLNHPTLISSNYNNASGIRVAEYIELGNFSIEFINYFNDFITHTGTQDLSNYFGIEIKSITINLKQLLNDTNIIQKPFFEETLMTINEKKNIYNFIPQNNSELQHIKIIKDIEPFNINKNLKKTLNSFILSDDESLKYISNEFLYNINLNFNNHTNFLKLDDEIIFDDIDKKNNLLNSIELHPIDIKNMILQEKNNLFDIENNIYYINLNSAIDNSFKMIDEINKNDDIINDKKIYNFKINETKKNNLFEIDENNKNIIDETPAELNMEIKKDNFNEFIFLKKIGNADKKNINQSTNFDFNINLNYSFDKLNFINASGINASGINANGINANIDDFNLDDFNLDDFNFNNENINTINNNENKKNIFSSTNLQYLNINEPSININNYSNDTPFLNNLKINNKLKMMSINSENIKIDIRENEEKTLLSTINKNIIIDVNNFIPKEDLNKKNNYEIPPNLELNINIDNPDKFNNFLNNSFVNSDDLLKEKQKELILNGLKITTKCIINVYQLVYNENRIATGLGDFIRGSYFLIEFCKKYNFKYFIDFSNHPIKNFLKKYNKIQLNEKIKNIYKKINKFELDNFNPLIDSNKFINNYSNKEIYFNFLEYLSNQDKNEKNIFIYTITFPNEGLINNCKKIMQDILEPTDKMNLLVNIKLKMLDLKPYLYEIIHIRCGDEYLSNQTINNERININFILSDLDKLNQNKKYLLISDNNYIKSFIKEKYYFINILYHDIVHTGETREIILKKLENTMLDFYLISKSKNVMSYSVYQHGSGFSKWCAFTYDIPYYCKYFGKG